MSFRGHYFFVRAAMPTSGNVMPHRTGLCSLKIQADRQARHNVRRERSVRWRAGQLTDGLSAADSMHPDFPNTHQTFY